MPWCPECESEYDDHVTRCKQCDVDLVEDLKEVVRYEKFAEVDESDLKKVLEYLKYSGFEDIQTQEDLEHINLLAPVEQVKGALKHLRIFFYNLEKEKAQEDESEETQAEVVEYETDRERNASKIKEMRSSASSFMVIGGLLLIFGLLNLIGTLKVLDSKMYLYGILIIGVGFLLIGYYTLKKIPTYQTEITEREALIKEMVNWYQESNDLDNFYQSKNIDPSQIDEGALYFQAVDVIKAELIERFDSYEQALVNGAAEEIFSKI